MLEQLVLDTNARKQLSPFTTDVINTGVEKMNSI